MIFEIGNLYQLVCNDQEHEQDHVLSSKIWDEKGNLGRIPIEALKPLIPFLVLSKDSLDVQSLLFDETTDLVYKALISQGNLEMAAIYRKQEETKKSKLTSFLILKIIQGNKMGFIHIDPGNCYSEFVL